MLKFQPLVMQHGGLEGAGRTVKVRGRGGLVCTVVYMNYSYQAQNLYRNIQV